MKKLLLVFFAVLVSTSFAQQQTNLGSSGATIASIMVSASPTAITIGGTSVLSATAIDSNSQSNIILTNQCVWTSSNPSILSVTGNVATGVSSGSATANCTEGGIVGSTPVSINVGTIVFTNPVQSSCANPCILPQGTNGTAYSFTFSATSSAGTCCTWAATVGSIPAWASLNSSTGALTGTPNANGTTLFTIQATDSASNTNSLAVSLTIAASAVCGPPNYACSTTSISNPGTVSAPITSGIRTGTVNTQNTSTGGCTATGTHGCVTQVTGSAFSTSDPLQSITINGTVYSVIGWNSTTSATVTPLPGTQTGVAYINYSSCISNCQNATFYDASLNPSSVGDCITRMTDGTTFGSGASIDNVTHSGGDNDVFSSVNEDYLGVDSGGSIYIQNVSVNGSGCLQVTNTGNLQLGGIHVAGPFGFSSTVDTRFWYVLNNTQLWRGDITSNSTFTATEVYDLTGATGPILVPCPGVNWSTFGTPTSASILAVKYNDGRFSWAVSPHGQGYADWAFSYDQTLGCASVNFNTGQAWNFCSSGCSPSTTPLVNVAGGSTFLGNLSTTLEAAISSGFQNISVTGTAANLYTGQAVTIDTVASGVQETVTVGTIAHCGVGRFVCFAATTANSHASSAPVTATATTCWGSNGSTGGGIHDMQGSRDGVYAFASITGTNGPWTQGGCAASTIQTQYSVWQIGTINDQWGYSSTNLGFGGYYFGGHESVGETHTIVPYYSPGANIRLNSALGSPTTYTPPITYQDEHFSWPHPLNDDSYMEVGASDSQLATGQSSGCTYAPQCPIYGVNQVQAWNPNAINQLPILFFHTYSGNPAGSLYAHLASGVGDTQFGAANAVGYTTAKGNFFCWGSTIFQSLGNDKTANPRADMFCGALR